MKTIENVTIYKCDFCKKELKRKHAMVNHESKCFHNPANFSPCFGCEHLVKKETSIYVDTYCGQIEKELLLFHCNKKEIFVHPRTVNCDIDLGDDVNEE